MDAASLKRAFGLYPRPALAELLSHWLNQRVYRQHQRCEPLMSAVDLV